MTFNGYIFHKTSKGQGNLIFRIEFHYENSIHNSMYDKIYFIILQNLSQKVNVFYYVELHSNLGIQYIIQFKLAYLKKTTIHSN